MRTYKPSTSEDIKPLIPVGRTQMFSILTLYKMDRSIVWPVRGRRPILSNTSFLSSISDFEKDEGRAVGKKDLEKILKTAKEEVAVSQGNSILTVVTPTKRSLKNYVNLLPQFDSSRRKGKKVIEKSDARYIAERSLRNAISHIFAVAVSHYQIGTPDPRFKDISKSTKGANLLYDLILLKKRRI